MPTNLPPEYFEVEERYKAAESTAEKIRLLEELISTVPKHKGTDKLRADMRRRLSKLKSSAQKKQKGSRHDTGYLITKEGAGQVVVVGTTNSGKSALVKALTNAEPEIADHPYTTWTATPGMMDIAGIQVQLIDTPPLDRDYIEPAYFDLVKRADIVLVLLDLQTYPDEQFRQIMATLKNHQIVPERLHRPEDDSRDIYLPFLIVANKSDEPADDDLFAIFCELLEEDWACLPVSAATGRNLDRLKQAIIERLALIRIYAKPPGRDADLSAPFVLKKGSNIEEFAAKVHRDFVENLKSARVWGSTEHAGQLVGRDYILADGDIVELKA